MHDVADLVLVGLLTGEWQALEDRTRRGIGLEVRRSERPGAEGLANALAEFRYERRLIAATELEAWLAARSMRLGEVEAVLCRRWLCARFAGERSEPVAPERAAEVMRAHALCDDTLSRCAETLRAWLAAGLSDVRPEMDPGRVEEVVAAALASVPSQLAGLGRRELQRRTARLVALEGSHARFRKVAISSEAIDARVAERRLEWTVVTGIELSFEREGAALETRLRVLHDSEALAHVAGTLGMAPVRRAVELGDAPPGLGAALLAAREGDLVGPWSEQQRWRVLEIDGHFRAEEAPDDTLRERARNELLSELVERLAAGKGEILAAL